MVYGAPPRLQGYKRATTRPLCELYPMEGFQSMGQLNARVQCTKKPEAPPLHSFRQSLRGVWVPTDETIVSRLSNLLCAALKVS